MTALVSIIVPFYQAEKYLNDAVKSVFHQTHENWELLLINDGSTDNSKEIALSFKDKRIRYFEQENNGVSSARNRGLRKMKGEYFCFLDADDMLTPNSLELRMKIFKENPNLSFVDGAVVKMDSQMKISFGKWTPSFEGNPLSDLVNLTGNSFFGPTWMIKRRPHVIYQMCKKLTHGEDLYFYMKIAKEGGLYGYTDRTILKYRNTPDSAMKNLKGLEEGYRLIEKKIQKWPEISNKSLFNYRYRYKKSLILSYIRNLEFLNALKQFK